MQAVIGPDDLKKEFEALIAQPPFNGEVTHRTRPIFIAKWRELLAGRGVKGNAWVDTLLRSLGK